MSNPADDNTAKYASKTRVERIPLTYYRRGDPLDRTKTVLTVLAVLGFGAWAAFGLVADPKQHSPGQVASVHAMWNTQCAACHTPFEPTSGDSLALFGESKRHGIVQCTQCHVGGAHHDNFEFAKENACASCHHEHRGLDAKLAVVADANCASCHRDVDAHATKAALVARTPPFVAEKIRSFVDGHPEFQSLAGPDPGRLKFSHARHMALGQKLLPGDLEMPKKLAALPERYRAAYETEAVGAERVIQLNCASCHETGPPSGSVPGGTVPTGGDYMQPVDFERHCAACHQQTYAPVAETDAKLEVMPHGLAPREMEQIVRGAIVDRFLAEKPDPAATETTDLGFPGKTPKAETTETKAWIAEHQPHAERMLTNRCAQCHEFPAGAADASLTSPLTTAPLRTDVPAVWLKNTKFDHRAHRSMSCVDCHAAAAKAWEAGKPTLDHEQVMIEGYRSCVKCHAPQVAGGTAGARFDCVACHRYHGSDKPPRFFDRTFQPLDPHDRRSLSRLLQQK